MSIWPMDPVAKRESPHLVPYQALFTTLVTYVLHVPWTPLLELLLLSTLSFSLLTTRMLLREHGKRLLHFRVRLELQ
jgi:hypothetical protein